MSNRSTPTPEVASRTVHLPDALADVSRLIDALFDEWLAVPGEARARLFEAMRHAAIGGGKRLRPLLTVATADLFDVERERSSRVAAAIEAIHVYSLIHDDLPCMDDDDLRRGKPTVHRAYDEATAVLAGDALHALAFEVLADPATHFDPRVRIDLVALVAAASGPDGMAGGQMMDLAAETSADPFDLPTVTRLQQLKTGALITASVEAGAVLGRASDEARTRLTGYARDLGLAFQIADDLLDEEGDEAVAGKALHKDGRAGKATFLSHMGAHDARAQARRLADQAIGHLSSWGAEADVLRAVARFVTERDR